MVRPQFRPHCGSDNLASWVQIVLSVAEHHGNLVPWQMLAQRTGAVLRHAELTSTQEVDVEASHRPTSWPRCLSALSRLKHCGS